MAHTLEQRGLNNQWRQVRVGKITVVVRIFLAAHGARLITIRVVEAGFLNHSSAVLDQLDLATHFILDGALHESEGIEILDLTAGAELSLSDRTHRHVGIHSKRAFLHVAVANAQPGDQAVQRAGVGNRLKRRAHLGLAHDLQQRRSSTVQVDARHAGQRSAPQPAHCVFMQRLAGILFKVSPGQVDHFFMRALAVLPGQRQAAAADHRDLVLADLIPLGQIRVEIIFSGKDRTRGDVRANRQSESHGAFQRGGVHDRQDSGQRQINRAGLRVGSRTECGRCPGKNLRSGRELHMRLEPDDHFPAFHCVHILIIG